MHKIDIAAGGVVAADTQKSVEAVDQALLDLANLCASIVSVSKASRLPISTAQRALSSAGAGLTGLIATRAEISDATRELIAIQRKSTLKETGFGCAGGFPESGHATHPMTGQTVD